jgi:hypothetical protein
MMPTVGRYLFILAALAVAFGVSVLMLAYVVKPGPQPMSVEIPADRLNKR